MEIRDEKDWEDIREVAKHAPKLTEKQSKIFALLIKMRESSTEIDKKHQHQVDLVDEILRFIRYSIFGKDGGGSPRMQTFKISQLANLTRMFIALVRFKGKYNWVINKTTMFGKTFFETLDFFSIFRLVGDERTARMFLFDIMYFRSPRSHVMINVFLDTWQEILLWTGNEETIIDPFLETVIWMIYNTGPSTSLADMKVFSPLFTILYFKGEYYS